MGPEPVTTAVARRLARIPADAAICVGFSGGLDSSVLLHLLATHADAKGRRISALHVHHGLSPNADQWAKSCERFCAHHGVPLAVVAVRVDVASGEGLEAAARLARYAAYAARAEPYVALAHHRDDQAETLLLQLLRGTGLKGIAAMPELRAIRGTGVQIFRPLLEQSRAAIEEYARAEKLRWIDDESNAALRHDRNFIRHQVAPLLEQRFDGWTQAMARFARHAGAANELLEELASLDGVPQAAGEPYALPAGLSEVRRANALRSFLARNAVAMPSEARLAEMARQLFKAREDARVRIDHAGISLVRYRGGVVIERGLDPGDPWRVEWHRESDLELGNERGWVHFEKVVGEGIGVAAIAGGDWHFAPRRGGECMRLAAQRPSRTLKNLLQEHEIPAWDRQRLPLLFHGDRLVWVPGVGIAAEYACESGQEGFSPSWRVAGKAPLC